MCIIISIRLTLNIDRVARNHNLCPHCPRDKINSPRRRTHTSIGSQLHHGSAGSSITRTLILFPTTQNTRRRQHTRSPTRPPRHSLLRGRTFLSHIHDTLPSPTRLSLTSKPIPSTVASNQTARPLAQTAFRLRATQATRRHRSPPPWSPSASNDRFQTLLLPQPPQAIRALDGIPCQRGVKIALGSI